MWPWGHAAVGYIALWVVTTARRRGPPSRSQAVVGLLATQVPDLIDKPLAWTFAILPTGRSLGHSLLTAVVLIAVAAALARRYDRRDLLVAFAVGHVSGILTDLPTEVLSGEFSRATFLLWPVLPSPEYDIEPSFLAHLAAFEVTTSVLIQTIAALVALVLFQLSHYWVASR